MMDMIKKHTVERSANWETICSLIDQTKEMLHKTKLQSRIFVYRKSHVNSNYTNKLIMRQTPSSNTRDKVPLGSSSPSIDTENLPASYQQGKAPEEYEKSTSATRTQGVDSQPTQFDDALGQETRIKRTKLGDASVRIAAYKSGPMNRAESGLDRLVANSPEPRTINGQDEGPKEESSTVRSANGDVTYEKQEPLFVIDVNPTPVSLTGIAIKSPKRGSSPGEIDEGQEVKKAKTHHIDGEGPSPEIFEVEYEDISQEVDARLKEKEEKRKRKKDKKRLRGEDITSDIAAPDATTTAEEPGRPKRKKKKLRQNHDMYVEATRTKKRSGAEGDESQGGRKNKRHKKRKEGKNS